MNLIIKTAIKNSEHVFFLHEGEMYCRAILDWNQFIHVYPIKRTVSVLPYGKDIRSDSRVLLCAQVIVIHTLAPLLRLPIDKKSQQAFLTFTYNA